VSRIRRARAAAYGSFASQGLCYSVVLTRMPRVQRAYGLSDGTVNLVLLALPISAAAGSLVSGACIRRYGAGAVLRVAQPALCLAVMAIGIFGQAAAVVVALCLCGVFFGLMDTAMTTHGIDVQLRHGRSLIGGFFAVWGTSVMLGSVWVAIANKNDLSVSEGFLTAALAALALTLATWRNILPGRPQMPPHPGRLGRRRSSPSRTLVAICLAMVCAATAEAAVTGFAVRYMNDELAGTDSVAPLAVTAFMAALVLGRTIVDRLAGRYGAAATVRSGAVLGGFGLAAAVAAPHPAVALCGFALAGLGLSVVSPLGYAAAGRPDVAGGANAAAGTAVAGANVFNYAGFVLGPAVFAVVQPPTNSRACFLVIALLTPVIAAMAGRFGAAAAPTAEPRRVGTVS